MFQSVLMWVCIPSAAVLFTAALVLWLHERGIRPVAEVMTRFRRLPIFARIVLLVFVANLIVYGSTKTNQVDGASSTTNAPAGGEDPGTDSGSPTNGPWTGDGPSTNGLLMTMAMPPPLSLPPVAGPLDGFVIAGLEDVTNRTGFTDAEVSSGYAVWRVGTNETHRFDAFPGAEVAEEWRLRGAAEAWAGFACTNGFTGPVLIDTLGRICWSNRVYVALGLPLGMVPEANESLLDETNRPSVAWCAVTDWNSVIVTWQNALLGRDTNMPVSVQAEFIPDGTYVYWYDLSRAGTNLTSILYYPIRPEDLENEDRDGDGVPTWREVTEYHCDPGLVDSDGDGIPDPTEILNGTDPSVRSVPNADIVARITCSPTNDVYRDCTVVSNGTLVSMKLWDGFAADWDSDGDIVFERTLDLGSQNGTQHYFLSSRPDAAGDWDVRGMVLEWDDGWGLSGSATASPLGDSFYLPLTNFSPTVTIRLRATGPKVRCPKPMWLLGYSPSVEYASGGHFVVSEDETQAALVLNRQDGMTVNLSFDRSMRPCNAPLYPAELEMPWVEDMEWQTDGRMTYSGDGDTGTLTIDRPGEYDLPAFGVDEITNPSGLFGNNWGGGSWIVVIDPSISWGGCHRYSSVGCSYDWWNEEYDLEYSWPLNSRCLWNAWQHNYGGGQDECTCEPEVRSGAEGSGAWLAETGYCFNGDGTATGYVTIFGQTVWSDTCEHSYGDTVDDGIGGGTHTGCDLLTKLEECEDCEDSCTGGKCNYGEGSGLHSVKFRLTLGTPRKGQTSGWVFFESDTPVWIVPSLFDWTARDDANVTYSSYGSTRRWQCADNRGWDVEMTTISQGVRLTVRDHAAQTLDHTWDIWNEGGVRSRVRMVRRNKLGLRMSDETYSHESGDWSKRDNVSGLKETLHKSNDVNGSGTVTEIRTKYDADDNQLDRTESVSTRIGDYDNAVMRETYFEQDTGYNVRWRRASYWDDPAHAARHGQLKLLYGNSTPWEFHDWNGSGFETVRIEQLNGSSESYVGDGDLSAGVEAYAAAHPRLEATVTIFGYAPVGSDDRDSGDNGRVRSETKYVVKGGTVTCVSKQWFVYTHVWTSNWYWALRTDTYRAAAPTYSWNHPDNAHSYVTVYDEREYGVPLVLRGQVAEELDEDGRHVVHDAWEGWGSVYDYEYADFGGVPAPTVKYTELDSEYGMKLAEVVYADDCDATVSEEHSTYDYQNRLLTTTYKDGTGIENAYSCCRKLWSTDKTGALTVRSAVTGEDKVYYAEEKVFRDELQTNGFEVVQHFMDALGREVRTVTYLGHAQGEATNAAVSAGHELTESVTSYPYGGDDYVEAVDARGKKTVTEVSEYADRTVTTERVHPSETAAADMETVTTDVRNGRYLVETRWDGKWKREWTDSTYDAAGCRTDHSVVETSDYGTVTNAVTRYDFLGRAVEVRRADGTTTYAYEGATSRKTAVVTTAGTVVRTSVPVYDVHGEEVGSFADGVTNRTDTAYEHDDGGCVWKVTRTVQSAEGLSTATESRERLSGFASGMRSERVDVDARGVQTTTVEREDGGDGLVHVTVASPGAATVERTSIYGLTVGERTGNVLVSKSYDAFGRCTDESRSVGNGAARPWKSYAYNALGDVVSSSSHTNGTDAVTETFEYDAYGRSVSTADALGNETATTYDANGLVTGLSGATMPVRYGYDALGNRTSLQTTPDGTAWDTTAWTVDPATGRVTAKSYPDGTRVTTTYAPDGLALRETRASGAWQQNVYDAARRLVGTTCGNPAFDASFALDALGRRTGETNAVCGVAYRRSDDGTATNEMWRIGEQELEVRRTLDGCGRRSDLVLSASDDLEVSYAYDGEGRVSSVAAPGMTAAYSYAADGNETGCTLSLGGATVRRDVVREPYRGERILAVSNFVGGVAADAVEVGYDAADRVVSLNGSNVAYNVRSEVTEAFGRTYAYLQNGEFAGRTLTLNVDGQVVTDGIRTFGYDPAGRLRSVVSNGHLLATCEYDALGRRVRKVTGDATHVYFYDGWQLVRELVETANGVERTDYVWGRDVSGTLDGAGGVGGLLCVRRGGAAYAPLYDNAGNVTAYVDGNGAVVARYAYDGFGNVVSQSGARADEFRFRYSTKYEDTESGLLYYGYRHYSPRLRVWLTRDPLGEDAGANLRQFCGNDPINRYDAVGQLANNMMLGQRAKWLALAGWFRLKGWPTAAEALVHSLQDRPSSPYVFHGAASKVKFSSDYRNSIQRFLSSLPNGRWQTYTYEHVGGIRFESSKDLWYALHDAQLWVRGNICKVGRKIKCVAGIDVEIRDDYDFHYHDDEYRNQNPQEAWWLTLGNNMAYGDFELGVIRTYKGVVDFHENNLRMR